MSYSPKNNEQGFTMVELVVGLAISLILMGIAVKIFLVQQKAYNVQQQLSEMQQNIRAATDIIVRETKMAGYDPTDLGFDGIGNNSSATSIQILADLDGNGLTTDPNEDITYKYYDDPDFQIKRKGSTGGSFQPLAENIEAFTLKYFNANGDEIGTTTPNLIRQIQITITGRTAKVDPDRKRVDGIGYRYGTLTTRVTPENLDF
ncbi:MAG: prepilin-type N-terminal cleavage/methylation domain-containing protein [Candidatus Scalindua sediminis]|nr:prepilin-type N-terminal cleavage/methylation domain-containing protein [Candidatus Scalindua sediminis]